MTKIILTTLLLSISLTTFGQKKIENELTEEHQNIKGTKISLIPPIGFIDGLNFFGFQNNYTGSIIMINEISEPYSENSVGIIKENFINNGIEFSKTKKLRINGLPAIFLTGTNNEYGNINTQYILVFGTDSETIMINGIHPDIFKEVIGDEIKKSMLTAFYEADKKINPFDALDYTLDVSITKLIYGKRIATALIFSVDGQVPTFSSDKTYLIVEMSFSEITTEDKKLFCINFLKQGLTEITNIEYTKEITIDGVSGYEIYAKGKNKETGETENIYQVILFSDTLYYIFSGTTNDQTDKSIEEIKKAVKTFKRK